MVALFHSAFSGQRSVIYEPPIISAGGLMGYYFPPDYSPRVPRPRLTQAIFYRDFLLPFFLSAYYFRLFFLNFILEKPSLFPRRFLVYFPGLPSLNETFSCRDPPLIILRLCSPPPWFLLSRTRWIFAHEPDHCPSIRVTPLNRPPLSTKGNVWSSFLRDESRGPPSP